MEQLICIPLSHTHYWYKVGMLKVPAKHAIDHPLAGGGVIGVLSRCSFLSVGDVRGYLTADYASPSVTWESYRTPSVSTLTGFFLGRVCLASEELGQRQAIGDEGQRPPPDVRLELVDCLHDCHVIAVNR